MPTSNFFTPMEDKYKQCRKCHALKPLAFFPRDRSRPDGRWHTCSACNRQRWKTQGRTLAADRKAREQAERQSREGLSGLQQYRRKDSGLRALPPGLRYKAQQLYSYYMHNHRRHLTQQRCALLLACACSNAKRLGNRSWARRMWRLKGYRRAERRKLPEAERLAEIRARNAGTPRHRLLPLD
jgi:hypothetical protein